MGRSGTVAAGLPEARVKRASVGGLALGAMAVGALAAGSAAVGALAVGAMLIGRLKVGQAEAKKLTVGRLEVEELLIGGEQQVHGQLDILGSLRWDIESPDGFFNRRDKCRGGTDSNDLKFPIRSDIDRKDPQRLCDCVHVTLDRKDLLNILSLWGCLRLR